MSTRIRCRRPVRANRGASGRRLAGRGSVSVELAILSVPLVALAVLAIVIGRTEIAYNAIAMAAHDAARAATIHRDQASAVDRATTTAYTTLADQQLHCDRVQVTIDASQFTRPVGQPAAVTATVSCRLSYADLGLGFTRQLQASFSSPVDTFRGRS
jgi:Flp pilus assembly protein TadG